MPRTDDDFDIGPGSTVEGNKTRRKIVENMESKERERDRDKHSEARSGGRTETRMRNHPLFRRGITPEGVKHLNDTERTAKQRRDSSHER